MENEVVSKNFIEQEIDKDLKEGVYDHVCTSCLLYTSLYQGVTLGGTGKEQGKRHPTLEDNVMVSAGAKIIGSFTIGENSKIGAGSVVLEEVPPNCTVVGVPGRIVKMDNKKVPRSDMDQIHLPDPVLNDIQELQKENKALREQVERLEEACLLKEWKPGA